MSRDAMTVVQRAYKLWFQGEHLLWLLPGECGVEEKTDMVEAGREVNVKK